MGHFGLTQINWRVKRVCCGFLGWPIYDTFLIVSLSDRPIYDPNPLRPNPNPKKPVSASCRVRRLGQTLTPLEIYRNPTILYHNIFFGVIVVIQYVVWTELGLRVKRGSFAVNCMCWLQLLAQGFSLLLLLFFFFGVCRVRRLLKVFLVWV